MGDKSKELKKLINNKKMKITVVVTLIISLISAGLIFYFQNREQTTDLYAIDSNKSKDFVYFDVTMLTDCVATCTTGSKVEKYYIAADKDYMILVELSDKDVEKMSDIVAYTYGETDVEPAPYRIVGTTDSIPSDLNKITLEYYKEVFPDTEMNSSNFSDYFGKYYIDTTVKPDSSYFPIFTMITFISGMIFVIFASSLAMHTFKTNKTIKNLEKNNEVDAVHNELTLNDPIKLDMQNVILTDNYLIDRSYFLTVLKYKDIVWMYEYTYRYNGMESQRHVKIMDRNRKMYMVASKNSLGKNYSLFKEAFMKIAAKCPNALIGYTNDNIKATRKSNFDNTLNEIDMKNSNMQ